MPPRRNPDRVTFAETNPAPRPGQPPKDDPKNPDPPAEPQVPTEPEGPQPSEAPDQAAPPPSREVPDDRVAVLEQKLAEMQEAFGKAVTVIETMGGQFAEEHHEPVFTPLPEGTKRYRSTIRELLLIKSPGKKFLVDGEIMFRDPRQAEFTNCVYTTDDPEMQAYIEALPEYGVTVWEDELAHFSAPSVAVNQGVRGTGERPTVEALVAPTR